LNKAEPFPDGWNTGRHFLVLKPEARRLESLLAQYEG